MGIPGTQAGTRDRAKRSSQARSDTPLGRKRPGGQDGGDPKRRDPRLHDRLRFDGVGGADLSLTTRDGRSPTETVVDAVGNGATRRGVRPGGLHRKRTRGECFPSNPARILHERRSRTEKQCERHKNPGGSECRGEGDHSGRRAISVPKVMPALEASAPRAGDLGFGFSVIHVLFVSMAKTTPGVSRGCCNRAETSRGDSRKTGQFLRPSGVGRWGKLPGLPEDRVDGPQGR